MKALRKEEHPTTMTHLFLNEEYGPSPTTQRLLKDIYSCLQRSFFGSHKFSIYFLLDFLIALPSSRVRFILKLDI